jgi:hypothetical protein
MLAWKIHQELAGADQAVENRVGFWCSNRILPINGVRARHGG